MKRATRDYSKSCIYKLCCSDPSISEIYVGSTTNFSNRKRGHRKVCNNQNTGGYNTPVYQFIRSNGGWDNWVMVEIEKYPATDKRVLHSRERYWIETLKSQLNRQTPTRTDKEYTDSHKQEYKEYCEKNRETLMKKKKTYNDLHKSEHKEYYQRNKESINKRQKEKHTCNCGSEYTACGKTRHYKTIKHKFWQTTYDFIHS